MRLRGRDARVRKIVKPADRVETIGGSKTPSEIKGGTIGRATDRAIRAERLEKLANGHLVAVVDGEPKKEVNIPSATRVTPTTERPRALEHP